MQLIIPAFNEEARLPRTLAALRAHVLSSPLLEGNVEVIVVDNMSTDATADTAQSLSTPELPVTAVPCHLRGKGAAVQAGMAASTDAIVGFLDADGATEMAALDQAVRLILQGSDVAIGSRAVPGARTDERHSWIRSAGAAIYRRCTARIAPGIEDTQCGFKIMRGELARSAFAGLRCTGFSFDVELLARLQKSGAAIVEFPVVWHDVSGSTFVPWRHGASAFLDLVRIAGQVRRDRRVVALPSICATEDQQIPLGVTTVPPALEI